MKLSKYLIFFIILTNMTTLAYSQKLNLTVNDGAGPTVNSDLSQSANVSIEANGDVNVTILDDAETLGDDLGLVVTGNAPGVSINNSANGTTSATLNWTLNNDAVFCEKTGPWTGLITGNPTIPNSTTNDNASTNGTYTLECSNAFGSNSDSTTVSNIVSLDPPTLTLSVNPTSVVSGGTITLSWTITNTPSSCTKSGDWNGLMSASEISNGSHNTDLTNITTNKTYNLICENSAGSTVVQSVSVTTSSSACNSSPPILSGAEDFSIIAVSPGAPAGAYDGTFEDFQQIPSPTLWPGVYGESISLRLDRNRYIAASFNSGNTNDKGKFQIALSGNVQGPPAGSTSLSISECPGDFSASLPTRCRIVGGAISNIRWSADPAANPAVYCVMSKNTQYFLNIVHSNSTATNFSTTACSTSFCGVLATQVFEGN